MPRENTMAQDRVPPDLVSVSTRDTAIGFAVELERLRKVIGKLEELSAESNPADATALAPALEQAIQAFKTVSEVEKSQAESRKLQIEEKQARYDLEHAARLEKSESRQKYLTLLTPIATTLVLALTLFSQAYQFAQSEHDKLIAAEDAQWSDAVKTISQAAKLSPVAIALNPFLKSKRYADVARKTAVQALVGTDDPIVFTDLFREAFVPVDWKNFDTVLQLDRALGPRLGKLYAKTYDPKTQTNNDHLLTDEENKQMDYIESALSDINIAVTPLLKGLRQPGQELDLRSTWFQGCDWSGVDLHNANIENLDLRGALLKGADLSGIKSFNGVYLYHTAWWEANRISEELFEHLMLNWPYQERTRYGGRDIPQLQYRAAITRLKAGIEEDIKKSATHGYPN